MSGTPSTTPHGRRTASFGQIKANIACSKAAGQPQPAPTDKWTLFEQFKDAAPGLGLPSRTISVLYALISFYPRKTLSITGDNIVWPSNEELSRRAHQMPLSTMRRHLAKLVDEGVIIRRDSPNGKRYRKREEGNQNPEAYGFDLSPLVARASEFHERHIEIERERQERKALKDENTRLRREIPGMIAGAREAGAAGDWDALETQYLETKAKIRTKAPIPELDTLIQELAALAHRAERLLREHLEPAQMSTKESQTEHHKESSPRVEIRPAFFDFPKKTPIPKLAALQPKAPTHPKFMTLDAVLAAYPDISEYATAPIRSWQELFATASAVAGFMQIRENTWAEARQILGMETAAITIAVFLQNAAMIKSPGGFLNTLINEARTGQFSLAKVLEALQKGREQSGNSEKPTERMDSGHFAPGHLPPYRNHNHPQHGSKPKKHL